MQRLRCIATASHIIVHGATITYCNPMNNFKATTFRLWYHTARRRTRGPALGAAFRPAPLLSRSPFSAASFFGWASVQISPRCEREIADYDDSKRGMATTTMDIKCVW